MKSVSFMEIRRTDEFLNGQLNIGREELRAATWNQRSKDLSSSQNGLLIHEFAHLG